MKAQLRIVHTIKRLEVILTVMIISSSFAVAQTGQISGVVTYYFNQYQGNKPDIGAKLFVVVDDGTTALEASCIDSLIKARTFSDMYQSYLRMEGEYLAMAAREEGKKKYKQQYEEYKKTAIERRAEANIYADSLRKYKVESEDLFDALSKRAYNAYTSLGSKALIEKSIDATGSYVANVKPGTYYVVIKSANRHKVSIAEVLGTLFIKKVTVGEGGIKDVSTNFEM